MSEIPKKILKPWSYKPDYKLAEKIDDEVKKLGFSRNKVIDIGLKFYFSFQKKMPSSPIELAKHLEEQINSLSIEARELCEAVIEVPKKKNHRVSELDIENQGGDNCRHTIPPTKNPDL